MKNKRSMVLPARASIVRKAHILIENNITIAAFIEQYFQMKSKAIFKG